MTRKNSATAAAFLSLSIAFVLMSVNTISQHLGDSLLVPNIPFGASLIFLSMVSLLAAVTSPSRERIVLLSVILSLAAFRTAVGASYVLTELAPYDSNTNSSDFSTKEVLLPGFAGYLLVFLIFAVISVTNSHFRSVTVLTVVGALLTVFNITEIAIGLQGTEVTHILLAVLTAFISVSYIISSIKRQNTVSPSEEQHRLDTVGIHEFELFRYVMNAIGFSVFACLGTTFTESTKYGFVWPFSSGIFLVVTGMASLRRSNINDASASIFDGLFWLSVGGNLLIEYIVGVESVLPVSVTVIVALFFFSLFVISINTEVLISCHYVSMFIFVLALGVNGTTGTFLTVSGWLGFLVSLYGVAAHLSTAVELHVPLHTGKNIFQKEKLKQLLSTCKRNEVVPSEAANNKVYTFENMLGYSRYISADSIGFGVNVVAASAILWIPSDSERLSIPWTFGFGGLIQFAIGFVSFSRGKTFESCSFVLYASFWSIWGLVRGLNFVDENEGTSLSIGCISFLVAGVLFLGLSTTVSKMWFFLHLIFNALILDLIFVSFGLDRQVFGATIAALYSLVFLYAFLSVTIANGFGREIIPIGKPIVQISHLHSHRDNLIWTDSRKATGVKTIADLLKEGKICGIPTDTVYVLVAACNQPEAVERAYKTKKLAEDRPMSLWISNLRQIESAKSEFGDLLWDFLQEIWPSLISAVVKKGEWMKDLGLKDSEKYIGRPDSIAVRIPNNTVTCHLIDQTGPLAVTSANPTGEADTTHHLQVLAKLGDKNCDGILCDGPSLENAASTVVDCRNINDGKIGFFRIGLTPKSKVQEIFDRVLRKHRDNSSLTISSVSDSGISDIDDKRINGEINRAFVADETLDKNLSLSQRGRNQIEASSVIGGKNKDSTNSVRNPVFASS